MATLGAAILGSNAYFPPWRLALFLGIVGLGVGAGQAVVIARLGASSERPILRGVCWLFGTGIGLGIGGALGSYPSAMVVVVLDYLLGHHRRWYASGDALLVMITVWSMVVAVSVSLAQQLLLRRYTHALGLWTLASIVAWIVGLIAGYSMGTALPAIPVLQGAVGGVVGGLIVGVITGLAMLRIVSGGNSAGNAAAPKDPEAES